MAEIRDIDRVIERWDWTRFGYELKFPRGCQFSDVDAIVEFDGRALAIESKRWNGVSPEQVPEIPKGQQLLHKFLLRKGIEVAVVYGDAMANDPLALRNARTGKLCDWRIFDIEERRRLLKAAIDKVMGIS